MEKSICILLVVASLQGFVTALVHVLSNIKLHQPQFMLQRDGLAQGVYFIEVRTENRIGRKKAVLY